MPCEFDSASSSSMLAPSAAMVRSCCQGKDVMSRRTCAGGRCAAQQDERYPHLKVGREAAMAWARCKQEDEPSPSENAAHAVSPTATSTRSGARNYETKVRDKIRKKNRKEGRKQRCQFTGLEADLQPTEVVAVASKFVRSDGCSPELDTDPIQDYSETTAARIEQEANSKTADQEGNLSHLKVGRETAMAWQDTDRRMSPHSARTQPMQRYSRQLQQDQELVTTRSRPATRSGRSVAKKATSSDPRVQREPAP